MCVCVWVRKQTSASMYVTQNSKEEEEVEGVDAENKQTHRDEESFPLTIRLLYGISLHFDIILRSLTSLNSPDRFGFARNIWRDVHLFQISPFFSLLNFPFVAYFDEICTTNLKTFRFFHFDPLRFSRNPFIDETKVTKGE